MKASELLQLLTRDGWYKVRQTGSHIILRHPFKEGQITFPDHGSREVPKGRLIDTLKRAKIKLSPIMRKPKVILKVFKEDQGYSATGEVGDKYMMTMGDTVEHFQEMVLECVNLTFEDLGYVYTTDEIKLEPDLQSFFRFYKVVNTREFSHRVGIEPALLSKYIKGTRKPTRSHRKKILKEIQKLGKELAEIEFLTSS